VATVTLLGARDPAQPLLTLYAGPARVELSGATTANWVAKSANLLVDGLGSPDRVGLLLPLHWQGVALLLAGAATGATVVLASEPADLAGCPVAFVLAEYAEAALDAGVEDVLALSGHPLGAALPVVPAMVLDYAREVPSYGDHWNGPGGPAPRFEVEGRVAGAPPELGLSGADRVLTALDPATSAGLLLGLLGPLAAGASLVLVPEPSSADLLAITTAEQVTATVGADVPGLRALS
jgi:uncharacterized protein (TIGR03089 family)